ncbi:PREDICTED: titin homolog isoform X2 [Ipomoea nil]|uniref:titin homolog isoform X2 n=1 Tax=Ipomoea nil TaxID=35883 RepID=UPI000901511A|nr:PREDICTED: titin homolog isoform X2 [Ipomoea nil]
MAAGDFVFTADEMAVDDNLGYPKAFALLCKDRSFSPYSRAPPFTFIPYALPPQEVLRSKELDEMFPIIDPNAKPTAKAKIFVSLLWKQLNHLGNAGFDPEKFRVDPYGNVVYYHADSASPLAWHIDHWFPCSRGGLTVPSNLRILQWQVCKKKHNQLEFLIPWWDLQVGLSINQFLSIFASTNSDFRHRGFSWLFPEGENEELNESQTVDSHVFPQHYMESKKKIGLAPAAVVLSRRESYDSALKSLDINRRPRSSTPIIASKKLKENEDPDMVSNPYQAIVIARNSLKQREEAAKMQGEIQKLDDEVSDLKQKAEEEKVSIQDLESILIKKRRRAEKCRKLAEAQSSHRAMLEKMIRDAMHQSVVYKEQVRLNLAASNALMARLEAQRAICDSAEKELYQKYKQRDELELQVKPEFEQRRKRSRMDLLVEDNDNNTSLDSQEKDGKLVLYLPDRDSSDQIHKQLRVFLEEEQKASEAELSAIEEEQEQEPVNEIIPEQLEKHGTNAVDVENENQEGEKKLLEGISVNLEFPVFHEPEIEEEDEESRKQRGKGNIEKWLHLLLESSDDVEEAVKDLQEAKNQVVSDKENEKNEEKQEETAMVVKAKNTPTRNPPPYRLQPRKSVDATCKTVRHSDSFDTSEKTVKERKLTRSESARGFRRIPSSPSLIFSGMKKRVDCMGKKPLVTGDYDDTEDEEGVAAKKSFIKSSFKTIVKAMKI